MDCTSNWLSQWQKIRNQQNIEQKKKSKSIYVTFYAFKWSKNNPIPIQRFTNNMQQKYLWTLYKDNIWSAKTLNRNILHTKF